MLVYQLQTPTTVEWIGLLPTLRARLDMVERQSQIEAQLVSDPGIILPERLERELFLLTQEALNNALKHARATAIKVSLRRDDGSVKLTVTDNGGGFDSEETGNGVGLASMRARAARLGGELKIESQPGVGTKVQLSLVP